MRRTGRLAAVLAGALGAVVAAALAGCSQIAAIAPVGGAQLANVRYAALDVLVDQGVDILTAPVCTASAGIVTCVGETFDGEPITVTSTAAEPTVLTLEVGGRTLYAGSIQDVIDRAARNG